MTDIFHSTIRLELLGEVPTFIAVGIQVIFAIVMGGLVGFDREVKMKAAGLKTNIMICLGATLYTTMSLIYFHSVEGTVTADPNRVAAQIVSGIGFLGAGAIIQGKGSVTGLTTAATMWVVAAIGYTIGMGQLMVASLFSITVLVILRLINPLNKIIESDSDVKNFHLEVMTIGDCLPTIFNYCKFEKTDITHVSSEVTRDDDYAITNLFITGHPRALERISTELQNSVKVKKVNFYEVLDPTLYEHNNVKNIVNF